jgi:hypothetical protein
MLFQFLSPAFMPIVAQERQSDNVTAYNEDHNSIVAPMFLKEKDEKEHEEFFSVSHSAPLLDLARHSFNLAASHGSKDSNDQSKHGFRQPPLTTLFCTFLI